MAVNIGDFYDHDPFLWLDGKVNPVSDARLVDFGQNIGEIFLFVVKLGVAEEYGYGLTLGFQEMHHCWEI